VTYLQSGTRRNLHAGSGLKNIFTIFRRVWHDFGNTPLVGKGMDRHQLMSPFLAFLSILSIGTHSAHLCGSLLLLHNSTVKCKNQSCKRLGVKHLLCKVHQQWQTISHVPLLVRLLISTSNWVRLLGNYYFIF
jgi:hypothetical protein